ncbi:hypothetical protein JAAARDRAFT_35225 [Jaapia argillacea MUCL 33604]|uniref:Uncharacterized protein n=1 Tax=Jaapia argillacea MUCL 33604 TaxID=933084 RepID=A0A067Q4J7_9AGAM|nr:hypothetical protein JAAARDRAFT_35225 [Jaapia argillacea MUCL 33604]
MFSKPRYYRPRRTVDSIVLFLSPSQPPPPVPLELTNYVSASAWAVRLPNIVHVASQYYKPTLEKMWLLLGFISMFVVPLTLNHMIYQAIDRDGDPDINYTLKARAIGFGIFVGIIPLFFLPIVIWKYIGARRVRTMLQDWAKEDRVLRGPTVSLPVWKVKTPGVFRPSIVLTITVPRERPPTTFHPDVYMPTYINAPLDDYTPQMKRKPGLPHLSVIGYHPIFTPRQEKRFADLSMRV